MRTSLQIGRGLSVFTHAFVTSHYHLGTAPRLAAPLSPLKVQQGTSETNGFRTMLVCMLLLYLCYGRLAVSMDHRRRGEYDNRPWSYSEQRRCGHIYIVDSSVNGTSVNLSSSPLPK